MSRALTIANTRIDDESPCYVIAEVGHNHQGSLEQCKALMERAKECGANAVKLQKRSNRKLFTRAMYESPYESPHAFGSTYGTHREALEFGLEEYKELQAYAHAIGIAFFATAFDRESADFLAALDMPAFKIASGDLLNLPLLTHIARFGRPMIISTGGAELADVKRAFDAVATLNPHIALLHCTSGYPAAWDELNLRAIETLRREFPGAVIGFSSHDEGIAMPVAACALGARIVEKHFTLDRAMRGSDHAFSLEPPAMARMVKDLRHLHSALGDGVKRRYSSEEKALHKMGKALVAARALPAGHVLTEDDLVAKSPADGLPPYALPRLLGLRLKRALHEDEAVTLADTGAATEAA